MIEARRALRLLRSVGLAMGLGTLAGCAALSSLSGASTPLAAYALTPLAGSGSAAGTRHLVIEVPSSSGAIATDRILVKPSRLQAAYLPGARWVDPVPVLVQTLLVQSMQASGAFRLVGRQPSGLFPDNTILTEIRAFEAAPVTADGPPYRVRIALTMTLLRESDGALVATRNFEAAAESPSDAPLAIAAAFDVAMGSVLRAAVGWVAGTSGGV